MYPVLLQLLATALDVFLILTGPMSFPPPTTPSSSPSSSYPLPPLPIDENFKFALEKAAAMKDAVSFSFLFFLSYRSPPILNYSVPPPSAAGVSFDRETHTSRRASGLTLQKNTPMPSILTPRTTFSTAIGVPPT
jgi:hypothetical protein